MLERIFNSSKQQQIRDSRISNRIGTADICVHTSRKFDFLHFQIAFDLLNLLCYTHPFILNIQHITHIFRQCRQIFSNILVPVLIRHVADSCDCIQIKVRPQLSSKHLQLIPLFPKLSVICFNAHFFQAVSHFVKAVEQVRKFLTVCFFRNTVIFIPAAQLPVGFQNHVRGVNNHPLHHPQQKQKKQNTKDACTAQHCSASVSVLKYILPHCQYDFCIACFQFRLRRNEGISASLHPAGRIHNHSLFFRCSCKQIHLFSYRQIAGRLRTHYTITFQNIILGQAARRTHHVFSKGNYFYEIHFIANFFD